MKRWTIMISVAAAVMLFTGCGSSSGGSSSGGSSSGGSSSGGSSSGGSGNAQITVNLSGADWAAYSASLWQEINIDTLGTDKIFRFTPSSDGKYGVAIHCKGADNEVDIYQATKDELPLLSGVCSGDDNGTAKYTVSGTVTGRVGDVYTIAMDGVFTSANFTDAYTLNYVPAGTHDLAVADISVETPKINKFGIKRDITVTGDLDRESINLSSEGIDAVAHDFTVTGGMGTATLITKNGTVLPVIGAHGGDFGTSKWYALKNGTVAGDLYTFVSMYNIEDTNLSKMIFETKDAMKDPGNVSYDPTVIADLNTTVNRDGAITFGNLAYTPATASPELRMYVLSLHQDMSSAEREIWVSKGWLGSTASYTEPDLSSLSGWKTAWNFTPQDTIGWEVIAAMANKSIAEATGHVIDHGENTYFNLAGLLMHWAVKEGSL